MVYLAVLLTLTISIGATEDWDYITFTQEWPSTFCMFNKCHYSSDVVNGWTIHGLWPSNSNGKDPSNCSPAPPFDINKLSAIYQELSIQWANLLNFSYPSSFWEHEWSKHGTCTLSDPPFTDELTYFRIGLGLKYKIALEQILSNNQIVPSSDKKYTTQMITDAVQKSLNVVPILECVDIQGDWYLDAIEICSNKNLDFINCPKHKHKKQEEPLKKLVHEIFKRIYEYSGVKSENHPTRPVNTPCGTHEFFVPI